MPLGVFGTGAFSRRGFSYLEVVIALGIIVAMLALMQAVLANVVLARESAHRALARGIAHAELETLRAGGYDALPASGPFADPSLASLPGGAGSVTVSSHDTTTDDVTVTVSWTERGTARSFTLETLVAKTGGLP